MRSNNESTSEQTNQLIAAARINAYAAQQNALAAGNFANSAQHINQGISEAVGKLNLQAAETKGLVEQAVFQTTAAANAAQATKQSSDTTKKLLDVEITLDRPLISVLHPTVSKAPRLVSFDLVNSGRTTAINARYAIKGGK